MRILINDKISENGIATLRAAGFEVIVTKVAQVQLENYICENSIDAIVVNHNTGVTQELLEACPSIKLIACTRPNMDNIDIDYAYENGIHVVNATKATTIAVAELVFAHLFGMVRFLHQSNREMPLEGDSRFGDLKKQFSVGQELRGKTLGIIGLGKVGTEVAKIAVGIGMRVIATHSTKSENPEVTLSFFDGQSITIPIATKKTEDVLKAADFISIHTPLLDDYVIGEKQLALMKDNVGIVNTAIGGVIDEIALVNAIKKGKVKYAGLDVYENQPTPEIQLLMNPEISLTPNIGGTTKESQERIGDEIAKQIIELLAE
ncbi:NAD(P)-dependent oxidoreductase [Tenacibaculum sp. SG-28]|uniref:NAD(P)-dependent oxidoreductase n=1 Tax=Tenacibaculum sp. SG-28 TaxID=754426 RepID=UPI000CF4C33E|nr:NAD(P)-dependent oxidoreductase [Tenacibaculum sp. SG-28]PQJ23350.1 3-phosphoglycerate dehydrogenase [Tenacibaculum sp. SG-28]